MKVLNFTIIGNNEIRLNNPQAADPLNRYAIRLKAFNKVSVSRKDEAHHIGFRNLEIKSKMYWDDDIGVYVPSSWIMEAIAKESFSQIKLAKAKVRSAIFLNIHKIKLNYNGMETVNTFEDATMNPDLRVIEIIKQNQVRIPKAFPQFRNWSIDVSLNFNERIITEEDLRVVLNVAIERNGLGDFRPTYGTGEIVDWICEDEADVT